MLLNQLIWSVFVFSMMLYWNALSLACLMKHMGRLYVQ